MTTAFIYQNAAYFQPSFALQKLSTAYARQNFQATDTEVKDGTDLDNMTVPSPITEDLIAFTLQYDCVVGARAFEYNGEIVVAAITTPFYLKSERDKAKNEIQSDLRNLTDYENITVTFDVGIYRNIREELNDSDKERLLKLAKTR